jgi:hypothetical protein
MKKPNLFRYLVTCPNKTNPDAHPLLVFHCMTLAETRKVWPRAKGKKVYKQID